MFCTANSHNSQQTAFITEKMPCHICARLNASTSDLSLDDRIVTITLLFLAVVLLLLLLFFLLLLLLVLSVSVCVASLLVTICCVSVVFVAAELTQASTHMQTQIYLYLSFFRYVCIYMYMYMYVCIPPIGHLREGRSLQVRLPRLLFYMANPQCITMGSDCSIPKKMAHIGPPQ